METVSIQWLTFLGVVGWTVSASLLAIFFSRRARRRADELTTARLALAEHYDAVDLIVDDPALPTSAVEIIVKINSVLGHEGLCGVAADELLAVREGAGHPEAPIWRKELNAIAKSRPDLVENFDRALTNGLVAMFMRWPGNSWKLHELIHILSADRASESVMVDRIIRDHTRNGGPGMFGPTLVHA